jgi:hypothetical protein
MPVPFLNLSTMWVLQKNDTKEYFCEFAEHCPLTTRDIEEAAEFEKASNAELLMAHLPGNYEVVPKFKIINKITS